MRDYKAMPGKGEQACLPDCHIPDLAGIRAAAGEGNHGNDSGMACSWISAGNIIYIPVTGSTNSLAKELAAKGHPGGTIVIAGSQTEGRGRLGRSWDSAAGKGLYLSVILRPHIPPSETGALTLSFAIAAAVTVNKFIGSCHAGIKWPNDIIIKVPDSSRTGKVCGILTETVCRDGEILYIIPGIGINISHTEADFPEELRDKAMSLLMAYGHGRGYEPGSGIMPGRCDGHMTDRSGRGGSVGIAGGGGGSSEGSSIFGGGSCGMAGVAGMAGMPGVADMPDVAGVAAELLYELEKWYNIFMAGESGRKKIDKAWRMYSFTLGGRISYIAGGMPVSGRAVDIDGQGQLLVINDDGTCTVLNSGEISLDADARGGSATLYGRIV